MRNQRETKGWQCRRIGRSSPASVAECAAVMAMRSCHLKTSNLKDTVHFANRRYRSGRRRLANRAFPVRMDVIMSPLTGKLRCTHDDGDGVAQARAAADGGRETADCRAELVVWLERGRICAQARDWFEPGTFLELEIAAVATSSSVITLASPTSRTGVMHDRMESPFTSALQAPHCSRPQRTHHTREAMSVISIWIWGR
jgi:hypothetical protein